METDLYDLIEQDLRDRDTWANSQAMYYKMRNGGLRRLSIPFPGASDLWYPLGYTMIKKLKPAYVQQMYGGENIASFVCRKEQDVELTTGVAGWFDYGLKQETNFERSMFCAIDMMLMQGFCPVKVYWDGKNLCFEQIDPLHLIVPQGTEELNEGGGADRVVHVLHMSVEEYKANPNFDQDPVLLKQIKGKGTKDSATLQKDDAVKQREGINCSSNENEIILWEVYEKDRTAKKITVYTVSPLLASDKNEVRKPFALPYNKGCFASGLEFPFFKIRYEVTGKGWYSNIGVIQENAPFESSLCRDLNNFHDHLAFSARPNFTTDGANPIPPSRNFQNNPGSILPAGLTMVEHPEPPSSIRDDMNLMRSLAEDMTQIPDFGASEHLTGNIAATKTATGQNYIAQQSGQGTDLKSRVFKMDLAVGLKMAWSIRLQYSVDDKTLQYLSGDDSKTVDSSALHDGYEITPNGSADSWNKQALVQKRTMYYQQLMQNPYSDKWETTQWWIEAEDPQMVKRLLKKPELQAQDQSEQQALECLLMNEGWPAQVHEADDDKVHLEGVAQFAMHKIQKVEMTPDLAGRLLQHGTQHMGQMMQKRDPALKQIEAQLKPLAEQLAMIAAQPGPPPKNVVPMNLRQNGADQSSSQAASPQTAASSSQKDNTAAIGNALASLMKAGAQITRDDVSAWLVSANMPPLPPVLPGHAPAAPPPQPIQPTVNQPATAVQ